MDKNLKSNFFISHWLPVILFCTFIFVQSHQPTPKSMPSIPHIDKFIHFSVYGILGILFYRAFKSSGLKNKRKTIIALSIILTGLYGLSDELHQYFLPYRDADLFDAIADFCGGVFGVFLISRYHAFFSLPRFAW